MKPLDRRRLGYVALLTGGFLAATLIGLTSFASQIDNDAYDWMFRAWSPGPWEPRAILLTIDEPTLLQLGGMRRVREFMATGLDAIGKEHPRLVAVDVTIADEGEPAADARLAQVLAGLPNVILPCDMMPDGASWEDPYPLFRRHAAAIGHVHAYPDQLDAVSRAVPLEFIAGRQRRWALALEAFRLDSGATSILESPSDLQVGATLIPSTRSNARAMRIRYLPPLPDGSPRIPRISFLQLHKNPGLAARFRDRAVFVGATAQTLVRDRLFTPYSDRVPTPGVEVHAFAYETLRNGQFLVDASPLVVLVFCALLTLAAGFTFARLSGWASYIAGAGLLLLAHLMPNFLFRAGVVFPVVSPLSAAWLGTVSAASWQHFVVRRQLRKTQEDKARYQQAIHFVTHEMRTPLTAIQGSSELISRYNLNDEKRKQIALTINSESKRLARMIQTFLDVERLGEGEMELKREQFAANAVVSSCLDRARPLAERKQIVIHVYPIPEVTITGDRELMEYAFYNLITNAIKYSSAETEVTVYGEAAAAECRLSVADQGIGMDEREIKNIFRKFYRTKKAEASGEAGTGIGLSIVDQIISSHGGRIEVSSTPGRGSCFTVVLPAVAHSANGVRA